MNNKKRIAFFSAGWSAQILAEYIRGMEEGFKSANVDIFLFVGYPASHGPQSRYKSELNIVNLPHIEDFDGVVVFSSTINYPDILIPLLKKCVESGVPTVSRGMPYEGAYFSDVDNKAGMRDLCEHVIKVHGAKKLCFIAGSPESIDSNVRLETFKDVLNENGLEFNEDYLTYTDWDNYKAVDYLKELKGKDIDFPDAIICANDGLAMACTLTVEKFGYRVPEDVIVTGFDFLADAQKFYPAIASVDQRFKRLGEQSAEILLEAMSGVEHEEKHLVVPCSFMPGESCGCCEARDFGRIRALGGREAFYARMSDNWVDRVLATFESEIVSATGYRNLTERFNDLVVNKRVLDVDTLHVLLDTRAVNNNSTSEEAFSGYSDHMQVLFSMESNVVNNESYISTRQIIPGYKKDSEEGHLYTMMPIFENNTPLGYAVTKDRLDLIDSRGLQKYQSRLGVSLQQYRQNLSMTVINGQLVKKISKDALTNVKNRVAYEEEIERMQDKLDDGIREPMGIVMFDINGLKEINDELGHEAGDEYIVSSCRLICSVFNHSPVFRIGGDEFVCILTGRDYELRDRCLRTMKEIMETLRRSTQVSAVKKVSVAAGMAILEEDDTSIADVFKRADEQMYENKLKMKGTVR